MSASTVSFDQPASGIGVRSKQRVDSDESLALTLSLKPTDLEVIAKRVAELLGEPRDEGFMNAQGAAEFLATTAHAIYHQVERNRIPHHRSGRRVLFDKAGRASIVGTAGRGLTVRPLHL